MDGALVPRDGPALPPDDLALREGRGCYTTARVRDGRLRHGERVVRRLVRDAALLGVGRLDEDRCREALERLGRAAFAGGEGIVRLQASRDADGRVHLVGLPRDLGPEPEAWRAVSAPFPHGGPTPWRGAKVTGELRLAWAREHAAREGVEEALLFDGAGRLVEGARTSIFVVLADGLLVTPPLARGGVAGVAREILLERVPECAEADVDRNAVARARELVATSAPRGARGLIALDGTPVGGGEPGPWARRLDAVLDAG